MIRVVDKFGNRIMSIKLKEEKPIEEIRKYEYFCPNCMGKVIYVDCYDKINHFRHYTRQDCDHEPETEEHIKMKCWFYEKINEVSFKETEYKIGNQIADVYFEQNGKKFVIECQCSPITVQKYLERTKGWSDKGCYVQWVWGYKNFYYTRRKIIKEFYKKFSYYFLIDHIIKKEREWKQEYGRWYPIDSEELIFEPILFPIISKGEKRLKICEGKHQNI